MTPKLAKLIDDIIAREGGYTDHPSDKGGPTTWGITVAVARANGYLGDMASMPQEFARSVYVRRYIEGPGFDAILTVPLCDPIAEEVVDTGVNMGPVVAGEFLQRCLNAFNKGGTAYADVPVDGRVGPGTIAALQAYVKLRGATGVAVLLRALNCLQGARYIAIADKDQRQEDFVYGWIANRVV